MLRLRRKIKQPVTNATQPEPQLKQCDICNHTGKPTGNFPLRRPDCCKPIWVCSSGHDKHEILHVFRSRRRDCPEHALAQVPEVEFIDSAKAKSKAQSKFKSLALKHIYDEWSDDDLDLEPQRRSK